MPDFKLSYTAALVLQTIRAGYEYGFDIMDVTALPSGTVYPTLRRLEQQDLINPPGRFGNRPLLTSDLPANTTDSRARAKTL
jgi:hypothetical protein